MPEQKYLNTVTTLILVTLWIMILGILGLTYLIGGDEEVTGISVEDKKLSDAYWGRLTFDTAGDKPTIVRAPCPVQEFTLEAIQKAPICNYQLIFEADVDYEIENETEEE